MERCFCMTKLSQRLKRWKEFSKLKPSLMWLMLETGSGYFGKVSIRYFHKLCNKFFCPIVNLDKRWSLVPEDKKAKSTKDNVPMIDVTHHIFFKVLGKGHLPENKPFVVKANANASRYRRHSR